MTSLVTGANSGIGKATAQGLAERGGRVILLCRNEERGERARAQIIEATGNEHVDLVLCDLAALSDVRRAAEEVRRRCDRLDVLVNNAGIYQNRRRASEDGLERCWAVNHFAPFLLTNRLRALLEETAAAHGEARVVTLSSDAHQAASALDAEQVAQGGPAEDDFSGMRVYAQTKLANVLFTRALARRLEGTGVTANAVSPGMVNTAIWSGKSGWLARVAGLFSFLYASPQKGAAGPLRLATDPDLKGVTGRYFDKTEEVEPSEVARDDEAARRLWEISEEVVRETSNAEA